MRAIEFYTTPEGEVTIKEQDQGERTLKESDTEFIQRFLEVLEEFYPEAYTAFPAAYIPISLTRIRCPVHRSGFCHLPVCSPLFGAAHCLHTLLQILLLFQIPLR